MNVSSEKNASPVEQRLIHDEIETIQVSLTNQRPQKIASQSQITTSTNREHQIQNYAKPKQSEKMERLISLDVYRGLTVLGMVMADQTLQIDGNCWWLIHAEWNGLTVADLVFPAFMFIMGAAIPLAVSDKKPLTFKKAIRPLMLFGLGLLLNSIEQGFDLPNLRIMGILQRLSIGYGVVLLVHWASEYATVLKKAIIGAISMLLLISLYVILMLTWSDEGINCPRSNNLDPFCNFGGYVDRAVFTLAHIMEKTDPEGIISSMTACFTTYIGYIAGMMVLRIKKKPELLVKIWLPSGAIFLALAFPLSYLMPLNKRLWSISYTFATLCPCLVTLSLFMVIVDIVPKIYPSTKKIIHRVVYPLNCMGLNPLAMFVIREFTGDLTDNWIYWGTDKTTPYIGLYNACFSWMGPYAGTLFYSFFYGIIFMLIGILLFRYKLFLRL